MQKFIPSLWYDKETLEAAKLYVSLIENSSIDTIMTMKDTPSGDAEVVDFTLGGMQFNAVSGGPNFKMNPSISLMVTCDSFEEVDRLYDALIPGGNILMEKGEYPFSKYYAWISDKYGLNWQLIHVEDTFGIPKIRLNFLFSDRVCGRAEEALDYYVNTFLGAKKGYLNRYKPGEAVDRRAKVNYGELNAGGISMVFMDHGYGADFTFNEAFSIMVQCRDQAEIDYLWGRLSHIPEAEQCGWLKDKYGVSWQIVPEVMSELMKGDEEQSKRVTEAMLKMKKLDIRALTSAYKGK